MMQIPWGPILLLLAGVMAGAAWILSALEAHDERGGGEGRESEGREGLRVVGSNRKA